jgi:hypothetical protein
MAKHCSILVIAFIDLSPMDVETIRLVTISVVNQTMITQVILMTSAFMMVATIFSKKDKDSNTDKLTLMGIAPSTD